MFLSLIVPVYNAAAYLQECLMSLENQDLDAGEYEIICVDDGSKDESPEILRTFAEQHSNVILIHQENSGVAGARNTGLQAASGEYIWFVDADDFLMPGVLGGLRRQILQSGCDRLTVGAYQFEEQLTEQEQQMARQGSLPVNAPWYDSVVWRSLIRREFLSKQNLSFRYPSLTHGEDGLFMYELNRCSPVSKHSDEVVYFYREHSGSAETGRSLENGWKKLNSYRQIVAILDGYYHGGSTDAVTADLRMRFLWFALQEAAKMPWGQAREALKLLHRGGGFQANVCRSACPARHLLPAEVTGWEKPMTACISICIDLGALAVCGLSIG